MSTSISDNLVVSLAAKGYWPAQARQYFDEKKFSLAVELCLRMLDDDPDIISGRTILARALYEAGQYDQAREQFLEILNRDPSHLLALKYLGDIMYHDGEEAAAMAYYRQVLEIDPDYAGLSSQIKTNEKIQTRQITLKRSAEGVVVKETNSIQEPAFVTETIADIYCDQGYYRLAGEVYRRLMVKGSNSRIAEKLKAIERKIGEEG
jgi:tetratricopeptide (TPR) repeat protein